MFSELPILLILADRSVFSFVFLIVSITFFAVVIGQDHKSLQNELHLVQVEEDLKKTSEELSGFKVNFLSKSLFITSSSDLQRRTYLVGATGNCHLSGASCSLGTVSKYSYQILVGNS